MSDPIEELAYAARHGDLLKRLEVLKDALRIAVKALEKVSGPEALTVPHALEPFGKDAELIARMEEAAAALKEIQNLEPK